MILNAIMVCLAFAIFAMIGYFMGFEKAKKKFKKDWNIIKEVYPSNTLHFAVKEYVRKEELLIANENYWRERLALKLAEKMMDVIQIEQAYNNINDCYVLYAKISVLDKRGK